LEAEVTEMLLARILVFRELTVLEAVPAVEHQEQRVVLA
jgi:hypothetical protein